MGNSTTNFQQPQQELSFTQPFAHPDKRNAHNFCTYRKMMNTQKRYPPSLTLSFARLILLWFKVEFIAPP